MGEIIAHIARVAQGEPRSKIATYMYAEMGCNGIRWRGLNTRRYLEPREGEDASHGQAKRESEKRSIPSGKV